MHSFVENIFLGKELYQTILAPVCDKYNMTHTEMVILLFLAKNPRLNTATDIVKSRRLTKSSVSMSVRTLENKGLVAGEFEDGNHRSIHLNICDVAANIIKEAEAAQNAYFAVLSNGFSIEELEKFRSYFERVSDNIKSYYYK